MSKAKKTGLFLCVLFFAVGGLWLYWEWPMPMDTLLPKENWVRMELCRGGVTDSYFETDFENPELDKVLPQMGAVRLTRAQKRSYLDDQYFQIILYKGESYPTMIYVGSAGNVQIAKELDFDHWKTYEGGEPFYRYLQNYSQTLPAVYDIGE